MTENQKAPEAPAMLDIFLHEVGAGATGEQAMSKAIAALRSADREFTPTHRHAEGGLYQVTGSAVKVHTGKDTWELGVRYRNAEGFEFVRTLDDFDRRFTGLGPL